MKTSLQPPLVRLVTIAAIALGTASGAHGQAYPSSQFANEPFRPYAPRRTEPPPPRFVLEPADEIAIPGPLVPGAPRLDPDAWWIETSEGVVRIGPDTGDVEVDRGTHLPEQDEEWAVGGRRGKRRFATLPSGTVVSQKMCRRCKTGWKRSWKLRMPGATPARPIALGNRVFVGSADNRIYGLKAKNGHRVWVIDAGGRILTSPTAWTGSIIEGGSESRTFTVLLVIPDGDPRMIVLDPYDGRKLAEATFPKSAGVSRPAVSADGRIVLARQGYDPGDAALVVLSVVAKDPEPADPAMTYNGRVPDVARPTDRPQTRGSAP